MYDGRTRVRVVQVATRTNVRTPRPLAISGRVLDHGTGSGRRGSSSQTATEGVRDGSEGDAGAGARAPGRELALDSARGLRRLIPPPRRPDVRRGRQRRRGRGPGARGVRPSLGQRRAVPEGGQPGGVAATY